MKLVIKTSRISTAILKKLEAAGYSITLVMGMFAAVIMLHGTVSHGQDISRGDLKEAMTVAQNDTAQARARLLECIQDSEDIEYTIEDVSRLVEFCQANN